MRIIIWLKNIAVFILSLVFLITGIETLIGSYHLNNPLEFVMYFFSASLLILVCIVGLIYIYFQIFKAKKDKVDETETNK